MHATALVIFQSTLPVRGATHQKPRFMNHVSISIHAPRAGSDMFGGDIATEPTVFQSTLPVRGATFHGFGDGANQGISIHAPRAGSDHHRHRSVVIRHHFNPRSPCGERLSRTGMLSPSTVFQSTLPVRGATVNAKLADPLAGFQSTLPVRGATASHWLAQSVHTYFNPRSPCGERHPVRARIFRAVISIHAPRAGSDRRCG